jgi:hypothetical protein
MVSADGHVLAVVAALHVVNDHSDHKVDQHQATQQHKAAEVHHSCQWRWAAVVAQHVCRDLLDQRVTSI